MRDDCSTMRTKNSHKNQTHNGGVHTVHTNMRFFVVVIISVYRNITTV